jgi:pyruvate ferredoxin oxidoreductase gamma subunit
MFGVRIHGRGGQGVVTAAELLAVAVFDEGGYAQAFPSFGSERTGAPVASFCRIDDRPIRTREPIAAPDAVIVADPTLIHQVDVLAGLQPHGYLLVNSARPLAELGISGPDGHTVVVPATDLALRHIGRPVPGAPLLGAFAALTGRVGLDALVAAVRERFPDAVARRNVLAARQGYQILRTLAAPGAAAAPASAAERSGA